MRPPRPLPPLYAAEGEADPLVLARWFHPATGWEWYAWESDGRVCFGLVRGLDEELGYFDLKELAGAGALPDPGFSPVRLSRLRARR